jgi:hypothetical protein
MLTGDVGMVDHQQRAAGRHQAEEPLFGFGGRRAQERGIHGADQVLCRLRQPSLEEARGHALHLHTSLGGQRLGVLHDRNVIQAAPASSSTKRESGRSRGQAHHDQRSSVDQAGYCHHRDAGQSTAQPSEDDRTSDGANPESAE